MCQEGVKQGIVRAEYVNGFAVREVQAVAGRVWAVNTREEILLSIRELACHELDAFLIMHPTQGTR